MTPGPTGGREVKIAFIGGGGRRWVPETIVDLALTPQLVGCITLYDINLAAARRNAKLGRQVFEHKDARTKFQVRACKSMGRALQGADFVFISILPGPIEMMAADIDIAAKYGVVHTVGDSTGPAGIVRALRCIPLYTKFAHRIMVHCPGAWVMNVTNPITLCVAAMHAAEPDIKAFGYCHEVRRTQHLLAGLVRRHMKEAACRWRNVRLDVSGVNHFTLATSATWRGQDLFAVLRRHVSKPGFFADHTPACGECTGKKPWHTMGHLIAFDLLRRFGVLGTAGDRHLAEFVPWYLSSEQALRRWGVIVTPGCWRLHDAEERAAARPDVPERLRPSGSEIVPELMALAGVRSYTASTNIPNRGQAPDLPPGHVVETLADYGRDQIRPRLAAPLPPMAHCLMSRIVQVQQATLKAGVSRDKELAFQAILNDPLTQISTDMAWQMFNEMLRATKAMLPGWKI